MRPRIEIDIAEIERLAGLGLTREEIALCIGVSETTIYNRQRESEVFEAAIKSGRANAARDISNKLFELAKAGDMTAIIWYEKTRCGRTDKVAHELTGKDGGPIAITAVAQEQAAQQIVEWRRQQMSALSNGSLVLPTLDTSSITTE